MDKGSGMFFVSQSYADVRSRNSANLNIIVDVQEFLDEER
jgi:hypothetical protein